MQRSKKRKSKRVRSVVARAPLATAILLVLQSARAQEAGLEEVIVTASKRGEESLQDVPMSIQAIGTEQLEEYNITKFDDYVKFLPSVSYQTFGPGFALVYMRGVSSGGDGNHSGPLPSVGVYLDEQPITTTTGALDVHLYDIARVESLAGPQGTLYGASSQAGTIRIITNKPDPSGFSSSYGLELNTVAEGGEGYLAEGHLNIPVSDRSAIRLVGWARKDAGYIDNVAFQRTWPGCATVAPVENCTTDSAPLAEEDFNEVDTYGARAALRIDLNDNWTVTPTVMGQKMYADGIFGYDVTQGELEAAHVYPDWSEDKWWQAALTVEGKIANLDVTYAGAYLDRQVDTRLDYSDYSYFYDALYSYSLYITDDAGNPTIGQYIWGDDGYKKMSHELRFSTPADRRVRFVGGLFYQQQTHDITQRYWVDNLAAALEVTGWEDTIWLTQQERVDEDRAVFGELSFDITQKLTATGGLRYYEFDNTLEGFFGYGTNFAENGEFECNNPDFPDIPPGTYRGAPCKRIDKGTKDEDYLGKVNLTYKFTDNHLAYVTWSEGYRPGGINRRGTLPPYDADFLTNYELGWKTTWADGRVRLNGALFYEEWDAFQFSLLGANGLTEIKNAAGAEIQGAELDLIWSLTDTFQVSGGVAYIDSELTENYCGFVDQNGNPETRNPCPFPVDDDDDPSTPPVIVLLEPEALEGTPLPVTPEWKGNLTLRQEFQLGEFESYWRASYIYKGSSRADLRDAANEILGEQPSYDIIDLSLGAVRGSWGLELFVNNVTDERTVLYRTVQCAESICGDQPYVYTTPPRTFGLKFTQRFAE